KPDDFPRRDALPRGHGDADQVSVHALVPAGVLEQDESAVLRLFPRLEHGTTTGGAHRAADRYGDVEPRVRLTPSITVRRRLAARHIPGVGERPLAWFGRSADARAAAPRGPGLDGGRHGKL